MKKEKLLNRVTVAVIILALLLTSILAYNPNILKIESASTLYASTVFDKESIMSVNIIMDDDEWNEMLDNAASEEYYSCDIVINGERYNNVGIRPKGNTSLSTIVSDDTTDRFSFKIEFDHYVTGQTLDGLDKLCLNNLMSDATYMKEYLSYEILSYMGAASSLYSYASINLNGEYWGLYLALEAVEDSFLQRTYGAADGELYKPETMGGGGKGDGGMPDFQEAMENMSEEELEALKEQFQGGGFGGRGGQQNAAGDETAGQMDTETRDTNDSNTNTSSTQEEQTVTQTEDTQGEEQTDVPSQDAGIQENNTLADVPQNAGAPNMNDMGNGNHGGMGGGNMGSDLSYTDDDLDSYDTIWESSIFKITDADKERVVEALEHITNQEDVEDYLDVDQMLRYIAANVVLLNDDSYFGTMLHNYYLYENDGVLSMIAWDYNLAFGGFAMGSSDATSLVNRAIDDVVSSGSLEDRPFLAAALSTDEYMEQYHEYLQELIDGYFASGTFENTITKIKEMISPYVESDPTAFYTYDEFETGVATLLSFVNARVESIQAQLDGEIPATNSERTGDGYTLVDGSDINVSDMGTQGGGGKDMGGMQMPDFNNAAPANGGDETTTDTTQMQAPANGGDETATDTTQMQAPPDMGQMQAQDGTTADNSQSQESSENLAQEDSANDNTENNTPANMQGNPMQGNPGNAMSENPVSSTGISKEAILYTAISFAVMLGGILFIKLYHRRKFRSR